MILENETDGDLKRSSLQSILLFPRQDQLHQIIFDMCLTSLFLKPPVVERGSWASLCQSSVIPNSVYVWRA